MQSSRDLWQDESTLLANFGLPLGTYFAPLPFYDQAAPPLALLTLDAAWLVGGGAIGSMRLCILALTLAVLGVAAWQAWRRGDRAVLLAVAMIAVTPLAIRYAVELKQYGFELMASLAFVLALRWAPHRPGAVMLLAAVLSFLSFSVMLVVGVAVADAIVFRLKGALRWRWLALLAVYTLAWLACYLLLFRPMTALQTANYPTAYERLALTEYLRSPLLLAKQFELIARAQAAITLACGLVAAVVLALIGWRAPVDHADPQADPWQPARLFAGLTVLIFLMWLARLYPISTNKQFLFTMPIGALLVASLLVRATDRVRAPTLAAGALALLLVPSAANSLWREATERTDFQDTGGLYAFVKAHPEALILPDILFEPTLRYYATRDPAPPRHVAGWLLAESVPMPPPGQVAAALGSGQRAIHQHVWQPLYTAGTYPLYADWVARHARGRGQAIVAATQLGPVGERMYADAARRHGCSFRVVYRSREVVALGLDCRPTKNSATSTGKAQTTRVL